MKSTWFDRVLVLAVFLLLLINLAFPIQPKEPETHTVVETKYITQTEYVRINQTAPMEMTVTGYTAGPESTGKRPGMKGYGITFTGTKARPGVCAVDPERIPLGTSLFVEGYGLCHAEDTGGKIKGYHVDVFVNKVSDAMRFDPKQKRKVWILKDFEEEST